MLGQIQVFSIRGSKCKLQCLLPHNAPSFPLFLLKKKVYPRQVLLEILGGVVPPGGQFNKTITSVIYKCSHCFRV